MKARETHLPSNYSAISLTYIKETFYCGLCPTDLYQNQLVQLLQQKHYGSYLCKISFFFFKKIDHSGPQVSLFTTQ